MCSAVQYYLGISFGLAETWEWVCVEWWLLSSKLSEAERMSVEADGGLCLGRIPSSPSVFSADEYRAWLSRAPSTSAIYERIRARDSLLRQQKAAQRFTFSAENLPERTRQVIWPNLLFYSEFLKRQQKSLTENV